MKETLTTLIFVVISVTSLFGKLNSPEDFVNPEREEVIIKVINPFVIPIHFLVKFYQIGISPIKQDNCQMYPSCSHYSIACLRKHGVTGILMTIDRLNRCGHDLHYYEKTIVGNRIKYFDPVKECK